MHSNAPHFVKRLISHQARRLCRSLVAHILKVAWALACRCCRKSWKEAGRPARARLMRLHSAGVRTACRVQVRVEQRVSGSRLGTYPFHKVCGLQIHQTAASLNCHAEKDALRQWTCWRTQHSCAPFAAAQAHSSFGEGQGAPDSRRHRPARPCTGPPAPGKRTAAPAAPGTAALSPLHAPAHPRRWRRSARRRRAPRCPRRPCARQAAAGSLRPHRTRTRGFRWLPRAAPGCPPLPCSLRIGRQDPLSVLTLYQCLLVTVKGAGWARGGPVSNFPADHTY